VEAVLPQLVRFVLVGVGATLANLVAFAALHAAGTDYRLAAVLAFALSGTLAFLANRRWTFAAREEHPAGQAVRFAGVSLVALAVNVAVLALLVTSAGLPELPAQAAAVLCATPLSFLGNKLWSFRR
jgi:dolichol-phosphate mannosyltransferase